MGASNDSTSAGLSLISSAYGEIVKEAADREFRAAKQDITENSPLKLPKTKSQHGADLGHSWRAAMELRYRYTKVRSRALSECSSWVSMPVQQRAEDIQSFDL